MNRKILFDDPIMGEVCEKAGSEDTITVMDMFETMQHNYETLHSLSANMIGVKKRIIIVKNGFRNQEMLNPVIKRKIKPYHTVEKCQCFKMKTKVERFDEIDVEYYDIEGEKFITTYYGYRAEMIQHMIDHLDGRKI